MLGVVVAGPLHRAAVHLGPRHGPTVLHPDLWRSRTQQFAWLDTVATDGPALVYYGDSLTDRVAWDELVAMPQGRVLNRGIAGDTVAGLASRIQASVPVGAAVCVVLIGTNDLLKGGRTDAMIAGVTAACTALADAGGRPMVVLESVPAGRRIPEAERQRFNARLEDLAQSSPRIVYWDLAAAVATAGPAALDTDGVHLAPAGVAARLAGEVALLESVAPQLRVTSRIIGRDL